MFIRRDSFSFRVAMFVDFKRYEKHFVLKASIPSGKHLKSTKEKKDKVLHKRILFGNGGYIKKYRSEEWRLFFAYTA